MTPAERSKLVKQLALARGGDLVGVAPAAASTRAAYYRAWLAAGHAGTMGYLARNVELRLDSAGLLPGARSLISVAVSYQRTPVPSASENAPAGRVAQYARGRDYHFVLRELLEGLRADLAAALPEPFEARVLVDSSPLLEREVAMAAGLGWIGKNTLVLNERLGSTFVLGELLTTLDLAADAPATDHCGTCTRCLDACPTQAFPAPYQMDASRCISYLTIEHRDAIDPALAARMGDWVFGCDICQEVCPFNRKVPPGTNAALQEDRLPARIPLPQLQSLRSGGYRRLVKDTAARRASRPMLRRNADIAARNVARAEGTEKTDQGTEES